MYVTLCTYYDACFKEVTQYFKKAQYASLHMYTDYITFLKQMLKIRVCVKPLALIKAKGMKWLVQLWPYHFSFRLFKMLATQFA